MLDMQIRDITAQPPGVAYELCILTIVFVDPSSDDIGLAVNRNVANTEALPVVQQSYEILSNLSAADLEAENLASRPDV
jgi:hypothetical protein